MSVVTLDGSGTKLGTAVKTLVVAVFGYSVARALLLWGSLTEGGVNPWAFLTIDIVRRRRWSGRLGQPPSAS